MIDAVEPLTLARWKDLEDLFGPSGAYGGCWCMYWRLPHKEWQAARGEDAKALFRKRVKKGPPPGLLAYAEGKAVGWLQIGPRADAPQWNGDKRVSAPLADAPPTDQSVWSANCFYVRRFWRGKGVTKALLQAGIIFAKQNGARLLEACPIEPDEKTSSSALYVGAAPIFRRAGFKTIARRKANRPLMRLDLAQAAPKRPRTQRSAPHSAGRRAT